MSICRARTPGVSVAQATAGLHNMSAVHNAPGRREVFSVPLDNARAQAFGGTRMAILQHFAQVFFNVLRWPDKVHRVDRPQPQGVAISLPTPMPSRHRALIVLFVGSTISLCTMETTMLVSHIFYRH